jgi:protein O-mannosyl-transferase
MLTLLLYTRYLEKPERSRYAAWVLAYALRLMAKPMLVTFPFVLLLLDFWPLRRLEWPVTWPALRPMLTEKIPLFVLAAASSVLTILAQRNEAMISLTRLSMSLRLANAAVAYARYLGKSFWPTNLAVLYPFNRLLLKAFPGPY